MPLDPNVEYHEVEVNETNIDRYNMAERFSQSREELLSLAAQARQPADGFPDGFVLSVKIPKAETSKFNVFENFRDEYVDAGRVTHCGYEQREVEGGGFAWVCVLHGKISAHDVEQEPTAPCIQADPQVKPTQKQIDEVLSCRYERKHDALKGTIDVCIIHNQESKHDISNYRGHPCLAVDPMTPAEGDPARP